MANILCYIEQSRGEATPISLETLGQARRLGSTLGATVFAAVAVAEAPGYGDDDLIAKIAAGGADKILLVVGDAFADDPSSITWESHGAAIAASWDACQPVLGLLPATSAGRELASRTAARVGAAFLCDAFVEVRDGTLLLAEGGGAGARLLPATLDFPVVCTVPPGRYAAAAGDEEAEVEVLQVGAAPRFAEEPSGRAPARLRARVELPERLKELPLPPLLEGAERVKATADRTALVVELDTGKGPIRIALGERAGEVDEVDFAAEGSPAELLGRLFTPRPARPERRR